MVKFDGDAEAASWLALRPTLQWVEALLEGPMLLAGRITEPVHTEPRWLQLGRSGDRILALIFTRRGDLLRPVSCRVARKNERKLYAESIDQ